MAFPAPVSAASSGTNARNVPASMRYRSSKLPGEPKLTMPAAVTAPIPKPRFIVAWRKANALERRPSPTTDASSESAAGHEIDAPSPITAAAPNASAAEWTNAKAPVD